MYIFAISKIVFLDLDNGKSNIVFDICNILKPLDFTLSLSLTLIPKQHHTHITHFSNVIS